MDDNQRAAYLKSPHHCPYCNSQNICAREFETDHDTLPQKIECPHCGKQWTEIYTLTGVEPNPCAGKPGDPLRIDFCPLHHKQQGAIVVTLVRMEQLKQAITERDWTQTEFQFDRVLRSLTKQLHETNH